MMQKFAAGRELTEVTVRGEGGIEHFLHFSADFSLQILSSILSLFSPSCSPLLALNLEQICKIVSSSSSRQ